MTDQTLEPGVYQLPDKQYFALDAVSNSDLKQMARSPAHYRAYKDDPDRQKDSPAMLSGRVLHCAILEPEEFHNRHIIIPPDAPKKPTKAQINAPKPTPKAAASIEYWNKFEGSEKDILTTAQADNFLHIAETVRHHPELKNYLHGGMAERVVIARDPDTGVLCRCKTDYAVKIADKRVILDLKSAEDARQAAFGKAAFNYGYFTQAAYYTDIWKWAGYPIDLWLFPVFEKEPPYAVKLYEILPEDMDRGREEYRKSLNTFAECQKSNEWPAYDTDISVLRYPAWAKG